MKTTLLIATLLMTVPSLALADKLADDWNAYNNRIEAEREASRQADINRQIEAQRIQDSRRQEEQRRIDMFSSSPGLTGVLDERK